MRDALPDDVLLGAFAAAPAAPVPPAGGAGANENSAGALFYRAKRKPARYTRREDAAHPWELAAIELERWLHEMPPLIADAMTAHGRAPFSAEAALGEQVDFWLTRFHQADGAVNMPAVADFIATADPEQVSALAAAIRKRGAGAR